MNSLAQEPQQEIKTDVTKPLTVVVWGDSIAAGGDLNWPALAERACNLALNVGRKVKIVNGGVGGLPAAQAREDFETRILEHAPDMVFIQFGLNDLRFDGSRGAQPISTSQEFAHHIREMVVKCRDVAHARVVVLGNHRTRANITMPSGRTYDQARADLCAVARQVATEEKVEFHDMAKELVVEGSTWTDFLADDGVHLSPQGLYAYARFAANIIAQTKKGSTV